MCTNAWPAAGWPARNQQVSGNDRVAAAERVAIDAVRSAAFYSA